MKEKEVPPIGRGARLKPAIRVYTNQAIVNRVASYATAIGSDSSSVVLHWIMEKLPDAEKNLFPATRPATLLGAELRIVCKIIQFPEGGKRALSRYLRDRREKGGAE
jgi:hypothetical protein